MPPSPGGPPPADPVGGPLFPDPVAGASRPDSVVGPSPADPVGGAPSPDPVGATVGPAVGPATALPRARTNPPGAPTAPYLLRMSAGWSWRILVVLVAVGLLVVLVARIRVIALAILAALLVTGLLRPLHVAVRERGAPPSLAASSTLLLFLAVIIGAGVGISRAVVSQASDLQTRVSEGFDEVQDWLVTGPLALDPDRIDGYRDEIVASVQDNQSQIVSGVLSGATLAIEVVTGLVLALFAIFFFLKDGDALWAWFTRLFVPDIRPQVHEAGLRAWAVIAAYTRGIVVIALFDALFIGVALVAVQVPLVLPLAVLTFLGAFIPIVGAFVAGLAAVLVALVAQGPFAALVVLIAIVVIQQVEGNVLHPVVMRRAVAVHPLVSVLGVAVATTLGGIPAAVAVVPVIAVVNEVVRYLASLRYGVPPPAPPDSDRPRRPLRPPVRPSGRVGRRLPSTDTEPGGPPHAVPAAGP